MSVNANTAVGKTPAVPAPAEPTPAPAAPAQSLSAQAVKWTNEKLVTDAERNFVVNGGIVAARAAANTVLAVAALVETIVNAVIMLVIAPPVSLFKEGAFTHMKERTVSSLNASGSAVKGFFGITPPKPETPQEAPEPTPAAEPAAEPEKPTSSGLSLHLQNARNISKKVLDGTVEYAGRFASHVDDNKVYYIGGAVALAAIAGADYKWGRNHAGRATLWTAGKGWDATTWTAGKGLGATKWTGKTLASPFVGAYNWATSGKAKTEN